MAKNTQITTLGELGNLVGKTRQAVKKWTEHGDWMFGPGPWEFSQIPLIKKWAAQTLQEDRAAKSEPDELEKDKKTSAAGLLTQARVAKLMQEFEKIKMENAERKGSTHDVADCRRRQVERVHQTKNALTSQVPITSVSNIRKEERRLGRSLGDMEMQLVIRAAIEECIQSNLAPKENE